MLGLLSMSVSNKAFLQSIPVSGIEIVSEIKIAFLQDAQVVRLGARHSNHAP